MEKLIIKSANILLRLDPQEIAFIEAEGNYSSIYLSNGKTIKMCAQLHIFKEGMQKLHSGKSFAEVGRSILVNKHYIYLINLTQERLYLTPTALDKKKDYTGMNVQERLAAAREEDRQGCRSVIHASRESLAKLKMLLENEKE